MARILLLEDDPDVRPLFEHVLQGQGYQVTAADTVAKGMAFLSGQPFDLAICDVHLPDGSGLAVADKATAAGVKALVVTAHGLSLKPGALARYNYLLKPLRVGELLAAVKRCLADKGGQSVVAPFPKSPA
jgi:DNA-binding response OmpR family regulator